MRRVEVRAPEEGPSFLAHIRGEGREDVESPRVPEPGVQEDLHQHPDTAVNKGRGSLGGRVRPIEPGEDWLDDREPGSGARRSAGILTRHQETEIRAWEVPLASDPST